MILGGCYLIFLIAMISCTKRVIFSVRNKNDPSKLNTLADLNFSLGEPIASKLFQAIDTFATDCI